MNIEIFEMNLPRRLSFSFSITNDRFWRSDLIRFEMWNCLSVSIKLSIFKEKIQWIQSSPLLALHKTMKAKQKTKKNGFISVLPFERSQSFAFDKKNYQTAAVAFILGLIKLNKLYFELNQIFRLSLFW